MDLSNVDVRAFGLDPVALDPLGFPDLLGQGWLGIGLGCESSDTSILPVQ
jgi:hypothetical protein